MLFSKKNRMNEAVVAIVADITGASGLRIIRANPAAERDPKVRARLRDYRSRTGPFRVSGAAATALPLIE
jgi:hypothetical protein